VADTNLAGAKIVWEGLNQDPIFDGPSHTLAIPDQEGPCWLEAEVQWPDGRRAFATNSVIITTNAPALLDVPDSSGDGFSFTLAGTPQGTYMIQASTDLKTWQSIATNVLPVSGVLQITNTPVTAFPARFYRAVRTQ
jgi:hypothetical protein